MNRVLVAYETWSGSTRQVAKAIGQALEGEGTAVDVRRAREVDDVSPYTAVVAGTSVHAGLVIGAARKFLRKHRDALARVPVAYFVVCMTMMEDNAQTRRVAGAFLGQLRRQAPGVEPVATGLFAGGVLQEGEEYKRLRFPFKGMVNAMATAGDHRDWDAIRAWAEELRPLLLATLPTELEAVS